MNELERICHVHGLARPTLANIAWFNCHHDLGVVLNLLDWRTREAQALGAVLLSTQEMLLKVLRLWRESGAEPSIDTTEHDKQFDVLEQVWSERTIT